MWQKGLELTSNILVDNQITMEFEGVQLCSVSFEPGKEDHSTSVKFYPRITPRFRNLSEDCVGF